MNRIQHHLNALLMSSSNNSLSKSLSDLSFDSSFDLSSDLIFGNSSQNVKISFCDGNDNDTKPQFPFHLAIPVHDLNLAREFYGGKLGLKEGRSASHWIDYNLYGHQLVVHLVTKDYRAPDLYNPVDRDYVPVPHFGCALSIPEFHALVERIRKIGDIKFLVEPHIRFPGQPGEQWTCFFKDPSGNSLEFKAMSNPKNLFAKYVVKE